MSTQKKIRTSDLFYFSKIFWYYFIFFVIASLAFGEGQTIKITVFSFELLRRFAPRNDDRVDSYRSYKNAAKPHHIEPLPIEGEVAKKGSRKCLHFWEEEQQAKRARF